MTAVAGTAFTAAQFNVYVRDNLNTTAPAVATTAGRLIVTTGLNAVTERNPDVSYLATSQGTATTTYIDLATVGPTITVTAGIKAIVIIGCAISNSTAGSGGRTSVDLTGANTQAAADTNSFLIESGNASDAFKGSWVTIFSPLTPGSTQFRLKYRCVGAATANFSDRLIAVVPF
jgi:hypothetical protein